jgi:exosortase B
MAKVADVANAAPNTPQPLKASWLPLSADVVVLIVGLVLMYLPTVYVLLGTNDAALWQKGEHSHGPIMLAVASWLLHARWQEFNASDRGLALAGKTPPGQWWAWPCFVFGAFWYVTGRALGIIYFEVGSFIPMISGVVLLVGGTPLLNSVKFPLFFFVFMVPLPGFIVDPISQFIKLRVSVVTTEVLYFFGYPISHTGVIISIGQYQLLVADACAGMRTLFMLEAMGIFYINVMRHTSWLRNISLALLIVPISFTANCIRVIFLALLTYHFGDEVGQGFLHGFAGIVLFVVALLLIISIDTMLRLMSARLSGKPEASA